jgi:endonuclease/exonuclease/phosphatase (EEP) superfamily protein YafD
VAVILAVARPRDGIGAIAGMAWEHLALTSIILAPLALASRSRLLLVTLAALGIGFFFRTGNEWFSVPATPDGRGELLHVVSWNVEVGASPADVVRALHDHPADLVALQELTPDLSAAIDGDPLVRVRYPHRALDGRPGTSGMGLLSGLPIAVRESSVDPIVQTAVLFADSGPIQVVHGHPYPGQIERGPHGLPVDFRPDGRDADLRGVRRRIDAVLARGGPLIVIGDFNTAPTDPAFGVLAHGLLDAHVEVGIGPGWTWRPSRFEGFRMGLLRIDLVLSTPDLRPIRVGQDCSRRGDHCLLHATLEPSP